MRFSLILLACVIYAVLVKSQTVAPTRWHVDFSPDKLEVHMNTNGQVHLTIIDNDRFYPNHSFHLRSENTNLVNVKDNIHWNDAYSSQWMGQVTVSGVFLGQAKVHVYRVDDITNATQRSNNSITVTVIREVRMIDHVFTGSVALLVSLLYINFGAALDLNVLRGILSYPVGPLIGFVTQFFVMPALSFGLGCLLFPNSVEMQLGLFFTGVSPSGGASNIWTVILAGNINLSVLMTTISNFVAFASMPLWIFTLGYVIFQRGNLGVPYVKIATFAISLIVPLGIGVAIQRCSPRVTRILVRLLKPISSALIIFIIIFAIVTNLYLFKLFSWQIIVAGLSLPWLGYLIAWYSAKLIGQNPVDALTIAIETGIQNTGIAIFLLRFSLPQPQADLTTVIPVSVAIMTPFPLLGLFLFRKIRDSRVTKNAESQSILN